MAHTDKPDIGLKVFGYELRTIIGNDPRFFLRKFLMGTMQNNFYILFLHCFAQFTMNDVTAEPIKEAAQVIESTTYVDVRHINMPVLMRL